jgi:hypothetical protein
LSLKIYRENKNHYYLFFYCLEIKICKYDGRFLSKPGISTAKNKSEQAYYFNRGSGKKAILVKVDCTFL